MSRTRGDGFQRQMFDMTNSLVLLLILFDFLFQKTALSKTLIWNRWTEEEKVTAQEVGLARKREE